MSDNEGVELKGSVDIFTGKTTSTGQDTRSDVAVPEDPKEAEAKAEKDEREKPKSDGGSDESKNIEREKKSLHYAKLDLIESVLGQGKEYSKSFFSKKENSSLAETANSSIRLKAKYREYMEDDGEPEKANAQKSKSAGTDIDDFAERVESRLAERQAERENGRILKDFMAKNGINADHADKLRKAAEGLSKALGKGFGEVLSAAKTAALGETETKRPLNLPSSGTFTNVEDRDREAERISSERGIPKDAARRYLDSVKVEKDEDGKIASTVFRIV